MAFTVREFCDLICILGEHPEWGDELRRHGLTDQLLALPQLMRDLADQVRSLAEAQARTEERMTSLERALKELADAQRQTQQEVRALTEAMQTLSVDVGRPKDFGLEQEFDRKAPAYFGRLLRGTHVLSKEVLARLLDQAVDDGRLRPDERADILVADLVIRGRPWKRPEREVYLVVEISWGIGMEDVQRAVRRADQLSHMMAPALPTVAGTWVTPDAKLMAQAMKVAQVTDGTVNVPEGWWPAS